MKTRFMRSRRENRVRPNLQFLSSEAGTGRRLYMVTDEKMKKYVTRIMKKMNINNVEAVIPATDLSNGSEISYMNIDEARDAPSRAYEYLTATWDN